MAQNDKMTEILFRRSGQIGTEYSDSQNEVIKKSKYIKNMTIF